MRLTIMPQTKEQRQISYEKNKEKILARNREYRRKNKEKIDEAKKNKIKPILSDEKKEKRKAYKLEWDKKRKEKLNVKDKVNTKEKVKFIEPKKPVKQNTLVVSDTNRFIDNLITRQKNRNLTLTKSYYVK